MSTTFKLINLENGTQFIAGNMDVEMSGLGTVRLLSDVDVVAQAFAKGLLTLPGSNPLAAGYGTRARDLIGSKMAGNVTIGMIAMMAESELRYLVSQQQAYAGQIDIPPSEEIVGLNDISVTFQANGYMMVEASVVTRSGEVDVVLENPGGTNV